MRRNRSEPTVSTKRRDRCAHEKNCPKSNIHKLPHHGTKAHYDDFVKFSPKVLMIPNGKVGDVNHPESYKICEKYRGLIQSGKPDEPVRVYCSNSNWCEMNRGGTVADCACGGEATIIFPEDWKPVR